MNIKFNDLCCFYNNWEEIVFDILWNKFSILYDDKLFNLLKFLKEERIINIKNLQKDLISILKENLVFLLKNQVIDISDFNSWIESFCIENYLKNNDVSGICEDDIIKIYESLGEFRLSDILNLNKFKKINFVDNYDFDINKKTFYNLFSDRNPKIWVDNYSKILFSVKFIFEYKTRKVKNYYLKTVKKYKYWSGWAIYSVFPLLVFEKWIIIFDNKTNDFYFYQTNIDKIKFASKCFFQKELINYKYKLFLLSYPKFVFSKYSSFGYKLILIEIWQISFMFRLLSWVLWYSYLEVQWYNSYFIYNFLEKTKLFSKSINKLMILHSILLN